MDSAVSRRDVSGCRHLLPSSTRGSSEKQVHVSMGTVAFSQRQPSTALFEKRTFLFVGSFDLVALPVILVINMWGI